MCVCVCLYVCVCVCMCVCMCLCVCVCSVQQNFKKKIFATTKLRFRVTNENVTFTLALMSVCWLAGSTVAGWSVVLSQYDKFNEYIMLCLSVVKGSSMHVYRSSERIAF